jgi:FeS assembly protein IscX
MQLAWTNRDEIAKALLQAYPDTDRLSLSLDEVTAMVTALPGFADAPVPPRPAYVEAILWTWMRLAHAEDETGGGSDGGGDGSPETDTRRGVFSAVSTGGG